MTKKKCELCESAARVYCGSDEASLCWDCDSMVHSANFIVSKHTRTLLCDSCQSPTPWTGSGSKLDPTISVCEACFTHDLANRSTHDDSDHGSHEDDDDDDDTENQVVPLPLSPSLAGSSSNEGRLRMTWKTQKTRSSTFKRSDHGHGMACDREN